MTVITLTVTTKSEVEGENTNAIFFSWNWEGVPLISALLEQTLSFLPGVFCHCCKLEMKLETILPMLHLW